MSSSTASFFVCGPDIRETRDCRPVIKISMERLQSTYMRDVPCLIHRGWHDQPLTILISGTDRGIESIESIALGGTQMGALPVTSKVSTRQ